MGKQMPTEIREPFKRLPGGLLQVKITGAVAGEIPTEQGQSSMYGVVVDTVVSAPDAAYGITHQERFWLGTEDDPHADKPETLTKRAGKFEELCNAAGFSCKGQDLDVSCSELIDREVIMHVVQSVEPPLKKNRKTGQMEQNQYAGRIRSNVRGWLSVNDGHELRVDEEPVATPVGQARPGAAPVAPAASGPVPPFPQAVGGPTVPRPPVSPAMPRRIR